MGNDVAFIVTQEIAKGLHKNEEASAVVSSVASTINSLSQFLDNLHQEWSRVIDSLVANQLDQPIISQVDRK